MNAGTGMNRMTRPCIGVDGCKAGWIAVVEVDGGLKPEIFPVFGDLVVRHANAIIAVDMPIGLPETTRHGGRGPEQAVRPLLGARQSSVFSIPARGAVYEPDYRRACTAALASSHPPRKVSKQAFHLFPKIRQIDAVMNPAMEERIFEVHPELAFWRLNGGRPLHEPKKVRGRIHLAGMNERRELLLGAGFDASHLLQTPPRGAAADDFLDACACLAIARRIRAGIASPFPDPPLRTEAGMRMAIWA